MAAIADAQPQVVLLDCCTTEAAHIGEGLGRLVAPPAVCVLSRSADPEYAAVVGAFLDHIGQLPDTTRTSRLTAREHDVLVLLAAGFSNADIARRLHLGVGTVKDHVSTILAKLEVIGRVQAALHAERAGLLI
ncbi:LuxR C-terminal-related transcriptional regulator [Streptomyces sp. NPDC058525]|uniref:helix-turn-helix domain-containing protein n=1 Tax=Streptomyces sp. NPDC058525 TaxID=3346538 RepID=UPI00365E891F